MVGCVDRAGKVVVPFEYADAAFHPDAPFLFLRRPGQPWRIHDAETGKTSYAHADYVKLAKNLDPRENARPPTLAPSSIIPSEIFVFHGKRGFIDADGGILVPPVFDAIRTHWAVIGKAEKTGKVVLVPVEHRGKQGAVDENGALVIPLEYDEVALANPWARAMGLRTGSR